METSVPVKNPVKKAVKILNFYSTILDQVKASGNPYDVCINNDISKQNAYYFISKLKKWGIIERIGLAWNIKKEEPYEAVKKILVRDEGRPTTNLHALNIKFPILTGKISDNDWIIGEKLNNWIVKYKDLSVLGGLKLQNNNNKSITVYVKSRNIENLEEIDNLAFKVKAYVYDFFKKDGIILDVFNCETKNINIHTEDKEAGKQLRKGEKFELDLNKTAEKIFPKDNISAKAWMDTSPSKGVESNDKEWKREYLSMPFRIRDAFLLIETMIQGQSIVNSNLSYIAENYKSHVKQVEEGAKIFKKLNSKLDQTTLVRWSR